MGSRRGQMLFAVFYSMRVLPHTACHCFNSDSDKSQLIFDGIWIEIMMRIRKNSNICATRVVGKRRGIRFFCWSWRLYWPPVRLGSPPRRWLDDDCVPSRKISQYIQSKNETMDLSNDPPPVRVEVSASSSSSSVRWQGSVCAEKKNIYRLWTRKQKTKKENYSYYAPTALIFNGSGEMSRWADCLGVARVARRVARLIGVPCAGTTTNFLFQK